jgi:hypothetical protein
MASFKFVDDDTLSEIIDHLHTSCMQFTTDQGSVERMTLFELHGFIIANNLNWNEHMNAISVKASKHLHSLELLKRSSVASNDLSHYCKSIIRPVLKYASPARQSGFTVEHCNRLEFLQRQALHLVSGSTDYQEQCILLDIDPMRDLVRSFFYRICDHADCLIIYCCKTNVQLKLYVLNVILIIFLVLPVEQIVFFLK